MLSAMAERLKTSESPPDSAFAVTASTCGASFDQQTLNAREMARRGDYFRWSAPKCWGADAVPYTCALPAGVACQWAAGYGTKSRFQDFTTLSSTIRLYNVSSVSFS